MGRITGKLEEPGIRKNTLFLFAGGNGTPRLIPPLSRGRVIQGGKSLTIDAGVHVPLIANEPGFIPSGRVCDDMVDLSDFLPTMAEAAGAPPPGLHPDGRSLLAPLRGRKGNHKDAFFMFYHHVLSRPPQAAPLPEGPVRLRQGVEALRRREALPLRRRP